MSQVYRSLLLFLGAGLCEIGGGYLVWLWLRENRNWGLGVVGSLLLVAYGMIPVLQSSTFSFGRVYAAYGGIFIVLSALWGCLIDRHYLDVQDWFGLLICLTGSVVMVWPR